MTILSLQWFPFGSSVCYIITFLQPVAIFTSSFTLVIITLERLVTMVTMVTIPLPPVTPLFQVSEHHPPPEEKAPELEAPDPDDLDWRVPGVSARCVPGQVSGTWGRGQTTVLQGGGWGEEQHGDVVWPVRVDHPVHWASVDHGVQLQHDSLHYLEEDRERAGEEFSGLNWTSNEMNIKAAFFNSSSLHHALESQKFRITFRLLVH